MVTIVLTWFTFKVVGLVLFVLSVVGLFLGNLPDHQGSGFGNTLRWIAWPLFLVWLVVFFVRGCLL